jgi:hypothetical protein
MSESSSNMVRSNLKNKTQDIQGGEKKVMKKSLKVIASAAMAFSMFASVAMADTTATTTPSTTTAAAAVKTTADFKDLANVDAALKAKIDALLSKGMFEGVSADSFGITENLTRAQFAKILVLVYGVKVDATVKTSSFSDVKADDSANGWAIPFIEAAKTAGLIDGMTDTTFAPGDNVTIGQFATALIKGLGKKVDTTGTPWYKDAIAQAITLKVLPEGTDGSKTATRGDLVVGAFGGLAAYQEMNKPATLSLTEVKATGAKVLTVKFNQAVADASKITIGVKKGAATVALASTDGIKWSDDKATATLTLDGKLTAGTYTVSVAAAKDNGVTIGDKASSDVTVTDETIAKIDFLTTSDYIARSATSQIAFKAVNQYGETSDLSAQKFTVVLSSGTAVKASDAQTITVNVYDTTAYPKDTKLAVTVIAPNSSTQITKIFSVGDVAAASKVELGDITYAAGKTQVDAGDAGTIAVTAYDQYGNKITTPAIIAASTTLISTNTGVINGKDAATNPLVIDPTSGNLSFTSVSTITADTDVVLNVVANGSGAMTTKTVKVIAPATPAEAAFGTYTSVIAKGDGTTYLPLTVKDKAGNVISADKVAAAVLANKITVFSTNTSVVGTAAIETAAGDNQGKVKLTGFSSTGSASITVLVNGTGKSDNFNVSVQDARTAQTLVVGTEPTGKLLGGATSTIKFLVKDQYGTEIASTNTTNPNYKVVFALDKVTGDTGAVTYSTVGDVTDIYGGVENGTAYTFTGVSGKTGTYKLTAKLVLVADSTVLSTVTRSVTTIADSDADSLTYSVNQLGSLFVSANTAIQAAEKKQVTVSAKDSAGVAVALPASVIQGVYGSDANVQFDTSTPVTFYVYGVAKGTAAETITVKFAPTAGNVKVASQIVTLSDVQPLADVVTVANATKSISGASLDTKFAYDGALSGDIKILDTYAITHTNAAINTNTLVTKQQYVLSNIKWGTGTAGTLSINSTTGQISYTAGTASVTSFTITVISLTNGKSASTNVTVY